MLVLAVAFDDLRFSGFCSSRRTILSSPAKAWITKNCVGASLSDNSLLATIVMSSLLLVAPRSATLCEARVRAAPSPNATTKRVKLVVSTASAAVGQFRSRIAAIFSIVP